MHMCVDMVTDQLYSHSFRFVGLINHRKIEYLPPTGGATKQESFERFPLFFVRNPGERRTPEYDQKQKYCSHKSEIVHTEIMLPPHAPPVYADRNTLWNTAEAVETQCNSRLARRIVLAIPREIPPEQQADLLRNYCREFFVSKGKIADFAIYDKETAPPRPYPADHAGNG